jgi:hypothetical protein
VIGAVPASGGSISLVSVGHATQIDQFRGRFYEGYLGGDGVAERDLALSAARRRVSLVAGGDPKRLPGVHHVQRRKRACTGCF